MNICTYIIDNQGYFCNKIISENNISGLCEKHAWVGYKALIDDYFTLLDEMDFKTICNGDDLDLKSYYKKRLKELDLDIICRRIRAVENLYGFRIRL